MTQQFIISQYIDIYMYIYWVEKSSPYLLGHYGTARNICCIHIYIYIYICCILQEKLFTTSISCSMYIAYIYIYGGYCIFIYYSTFVLAKLGSEQIEYLTGFLLHVSSVHIPLMPNGAFNICCPRDCVSRTANVERTVRH